MSHGGRTVEQALREGPIHTVKVPRARPGWIAKSKPCGPPDDVTDPTDAEVTAASWAGTGQNTGHGASSERVDPAGARPKTQRGKAGGGESGRRRGGGV
jgi:hypothetical protein